MAFPIKWSTTGLPKAERCQNVSICRVAHKKNLATFGRRVAHCVPVAGFYSDTITIVITASI